MTPRGNKKVCRSCAYLKLRKDARGAAYYWCVKRSEEIDPDVLPFLRACRNFAADEHEADRGREIP